MPFTVSLVCQELDLARLIYRQQPFQCIGNEQTAPAIEDKSERAAVSVCKHAWLCAVRLKLDDAAIIETAVNFSLSIDRNVFGRVTLAQAQSLDGREARILCVWTSQSRSGRWGPRCRRDRNRREEQVDERGRNERDDKGCDVSFQGIGD